MRLDEYQIANALIDTRLVMTSRLVGSDRDYSRLTSNKETSGQKTRTGDLGLMTQKSPVVMFLGFMRTAPSCCCSHVPALPLTRRPCL